MLILNIKYVRIHVDPPLQYQIYLLLSSSNCCLHAARQAACLNQERSDVQLERSLGMSPYQNNTAFCRLCFIFSRNIHADFDKYATPFPFRAHGFSFWVSIRKISRVGKDGKNLVWTVKVYWLRHKVYCAYCLSTNKKCQIQLTKLIKMSNINTGFRSCLCYTILPVWISNIYCCIISVNKQ